VSARTVPTRPKFSSRVSQFAANRRQIHGTELGLSIAKRNAEAFGRNLSVVSEAGVGSVSTLRLRAWEHASEMATITARTNRDLSNFSLAALAVCPKKIRDIIMARRVQSLSYGDFASRYRILPPRRAPGSSLYEKLNTRWHRAYLQGFMFIVLAHWGEHLVQAYQIYVMGWPRPRANGILGLWYPWLIQSKSCTTATPWSC